MDRYRAIRQATESICEPLLAEDYVIQTMPDVSPPKWHLGHTTWFFETMILAECSKSDFVPFHPKFGFLFNSYYEALGERVERPRRGLLSRPPIEEVYRYRRDVDARISSLGRLSVPLERALELGLQHEQQHQELLLMDIKHIFHSNPLKPAYRASPEFRKLGPRRSGWAEFPEGVVEIGFDGEGFAYDNERPRHRVYQRPFRIARDVVSCGEYMEFIEAGGYREPRHWLSEGWARVKERGWEAPLYWDRDGSGWKIFTWAGEVKLEPDWPVAHLSFYEADAFARWKGARLPTEAEWEIAASSGMLAETGQVWEWTASAYLPYPGFKPFEGIAGEYNGKFMSNQMVLRGSCVATPEGHAAGRQTYRNFFMPDMRWQYAGFRIARD